MANFAPHREPLGKNPFFLVINESFPHIAVKLKEYWGSEKFMSYLNLSMKYAVHVGQKGFPMAVLIALQRLSEKHEVEHPHLYSNLDKNPDFKVINDAFAHIGTRLKLYWGDQKFKTYIHELLTDTRNGTRKGFPFEVLMALENISQQHKLVHPKIYLGDSEDDIWKRQI